MVPETRYAKHDGVNIAYQVVGEGPDLVFVPGWVSHVEHAWEEPTLAPFLERLAGFSRLILLDRRGTGLSDPVLRLPTLEERMDDVRAVMDAAGSSRAFLMGISEGGGMCTLFAATHPDRTEGLLLCNTFARNVRAADYPWGHRPEDLDAFVRHLEGEWGSGVSAAYFAPSLAHDEAFVRRWGRFERLAVSPGGMRMILEMSRDTDVRAVLPAVNVPTLVLHRTGDRAIPVEGGRYLAERIPGARLVELPGPDHLLWVGDSAAILDEVELFVTGERRGAETDRVLATVLFVDIVDSTRRLAAEGDRRWRELLGRFFATAQQQLERFRGREVDRAGDGFLATFDGPARGVRCACSIRDAVQSLGLAVRAGLHTGECVLLDDKVSGIAVHLGARVCGVASANEVLVSGTVRDLVAGSALRFADRGVHALKGIPGDWQVYAVDA